MKFIFGSCIKIEKPSRDILRWCSDNLYVSNPEYEERMRMNLYVKNIPERLCLFTGNGDSIKVPYGCLYEIWRMKTDDTKFEVAFPAVKKAEFNGDIPLYDYQENAVREMLKWKCGVLQAPCGSGKTQMGMEICIRSGVKTLWLTHTHKLLEQSKSRLERYVKCGIGTITEGKVDIGKDITFATVQTLSKIDPREYRNEFDMVIVDECHHCVGTPTKMMMFYKVVSNCNARYKYGLSATLARNDGMLKTMKAILGDVRYKISEKEVGDVIIKADHIKVDINIDYGDSYLGTDGMLDYGRLITELSTCDERERIIVSNVEQCSKTRKKQLVLCHRVAQCYDLNERLKNDGFSSDVIVGSVRQKDRNFDSDIIISTFALAKEGLDIPELDTLHLASPQKDKTATVQSAGRVERNIKGKQKPVIYDYVDTEVPYCVSCFKKRKSYLKRK